MDLIAMAALLIQQGSRIETSVTFSTHRIGASFYCVNSVPGPSRVSRGIVMDGEVFRCSKEDGRTWMASQSDVISGLRDESFRSCVYTGGMQYPRSQQAEFCIGDL